MQLWIADAYDSLSVYEHDVPKKLDDRKDVPAHVPFVVLGQHFY
jgi:hypothetical protein